MARTIRISTGLQRSLRKVADTGETPPYFDLFAAIAGRLAAACDTAAENGDARELIASSKLLLEVLGPLGLAPPPVLVPVRAEASGDGGAGAGDAADSAGAELAELMGAGPTVGDSAYAGAPHLRSAGSEDR